MLHVKMFLFASLMVLFVGPICHCIGGEVPDAIIKEMFFYYEWLTDECELTTTEKRALSSPVLTSDDIHHSDGPSSLSHVSSFCVTQKDTAHTDTRRHTDSFYILEVFGVLVFQRWWRLVLR